jgi:rod shape determining protein RodA
VKGTGIMLPRATIGVSRWRRFRAAVDWPLILVILAICAIGLVNLYSATHSSVLNQRLALLLHAKFDKQVQWMVLGALAFAVATVIDYRAMVRLAWLGLGVAIAALVLVRLLGSSAQGSHRWFELFGGHFQPSEPTKLVVILLLARMFSDAETGQYSHRALFARLAVLMLPIALVAIEPDLGTAIIITLIVLAVGFLSMPSVWPMVHVTLGGLLAIPVLWETMHDYQKNRILAFIDPSVDPTGMGYHTRQSIFAVGSGKLLGKGFGEGTQNHLNFLPEHWTDFPFSVWGEEWGFVGSIFLIALFGFLLVWILNVALSARDRMGAVICVGVAAMCFWHVLVNIAMVLGLAPVVGVTLPFISYGGSSLLTFFIGMGLVANVSLRKHGY